MPMQANAKELKFADVNDDVVRSIVQTGRGYYVTLAIAFGVTLTCFFFPWFYQLNYGIGAAGNNHPAVWGTYLASFIFWIGLSHSGTLLSCILHLTNSAWRKAIYRSAEAMTLLWLQPWSWCTSDVPGSSTGPYPTRIKWKCGQISAHH
jgi:molybdopterin-containing oxidoreductase family membrane subunit